MVNAAAAIDTGSGGLALFARAASADAVLSADAVTPSPQASGGKNETPANLLQTLRYNSFEFSYRQDFGKIVLLRQEPETGEVVQQFPTDYYLERYAQSERASRQLTRVADEADQAEGGSGVPRDIVSVSDAESGVAAGAATVVSSAPVVAQSAPALPGASAGGGGNRVDITV